MISFFPLGSILFYTILNFLMQRYELFSFLQEGRNSILRRSSKSILFCYN